MKITKLECWQVDLRLQESYEIAYETVHKCSNVYLKIYTDKGFIGWGCAAPDLPVTGETTATVLEKYSTIIEPYLKERNPFHYALINDEMKNLLTGNPSALAMADMAIYDILAQYARMPLYQFLGGYRDSFPTSITIGILPLQETLDKAEKFIKQGFNILKLKGGNDLESDIEKVLKFREKFGNVVELRFDANQGYSVEDSMQFIQSTKSADIELLEQPTNSKNEELLKKVTTNIHVQVMADESLMTLDDVFRLTSNECMDLINIKLMKVGGITEAVHINSVAKAAGIEAMVGCMDESALGICAGLHFALSRPNIFYADLDGHFDLADDPFQGLVKVKKGVLFPPDSYGLGTVDHPFSRK
ncbi:MAG: dipeptide epimerase [Candidatus Cloacimonadales bacterium]|nr:dipeptide epimerase [Candidatus Cloacimonadales bacterium]